MQQQVTLLAPCVCRSWHVEVMDHGRAAKSPSVAARQWNLHVAKVRDLGVEAVASRASTLDEHENAQDTQQGTYC